MPRVHCKLVEHTLGLLNTTLAFKHGYVDLSKFRDDVSKVGLVILNWLVVYNQCVTSSYVVSLPHE